MNPFKKRYAWATVFTLILVCFTLYVVLDTFVIERTYDANAVSSVFKAPSTTSAGLAESVAEEAKERSSETAAKTASAPERETEKSEAGTTRTTSAAPAATSAYAGGTLTDSYSDGKISISLYTFREYDTDIYVADVRVSSAEYLKTAFADDTYGRNVKASTSSIAQAHNAIFAVNGDFYGSQSRGYVLRNGVAYRESPANKEDLVIYPDGSFEIISENSVSVSELLDKNAWQLLSFGPALVKSGSVSVTKNQEVGKAMASNPRTAIGIFDNLHYLFVVSDGRTNKSEGLSLYQLGCFMQELGVSTAYNLDGGGSSTMYFKGEVINNPTTTGRISERSISDIVYIGY